MPRSPFGFDPVAFVLAWGILAGGYTEKSLDKKYSSFRILRCELSDTP